MARKDITLDEIYRLPDAEFRKHFALWVEEDGVARALQAKLRKDLIEKFNKTHLGRRIYSQYSRSNRMILSPLILALNTIVAEFLYAQNCHFSLSVFSTEVPYRNTLPDFEEQSQFRFTKIDLIEIFEAIAVDIAQEFRNQIIEQYLSKSGKNNTSLLYLIFKYVFKFFGVPRMEEKPPPPPPSPPPPQQKPVETKSETEKEQSCNETSPKKTTARTTFYDNNLRYLNKYLIILSRKVKEMSNSLENLQHREASVPRTRKRSLETRKLETLNRSLEKISENLRSFSLSKRRNKNISSIVLSIDRLAQQMEKCTENFETLSRTIREKSTTTTSFEKDSGSEKTYTDWVKDLLTTRNGKKFTAKVEASLCKTLQEEKDKLAEAFEQKLENQKTLIKLKCRQKLLEHMEKRPFLNITEEKAEEMKGFVEQKLNELSQKHDALLQKMKETENRPKLNKTTSTVEDNLIEEKEPEKKENNLNSNKKEDSKDEAQNIDSADSKQFANMKPQMDEATRNIVQQERNIEKIVTCARLRLQEIESDRLDRELLDYFDRRRYDMTLSGERAEDIWRNYNTRKAALLSDDIESNFRFKLKNGFDYTDFTEKHESSDANSNINDSKVLQEFSQIHGRITKELNKARHEGALYRPELYSNISQTVSATTSKFFYENLKTAEQVRFQKSPQYIDEHRNDSPSSFDLSLKDVTLDGIVLSETEKSDSIGKLVSLDLKVPNVTLTRNTEQSKDGKERDGVPNSSSSALWE